MGQSDIVYYSERMRHVINRTKVRVPVQLRADGLRSCGLEDVRETDDDDSLHHRWDLVAPRRFPAATKGTKHDRINFILRYGRRENERRKIVSLRSRNERPGS